MKKNRFPMPALDPLTREMLAQWVLGTVEKYVQQAERLEAKCKEEPLGKYEIGLCQLAGSPDTQLPAPRAGSLIGGPYGDS